MVNKMELQYVFDYACRAKEGDKNFGYKLSNGKCYDRYMSKESWEEFRGKMETNHFKEYKGGGGNELKEGRYPPKMACYGSSSRFVYNLLKTEDVIFEKKLDTKIGGTANLDAYLCKDDTEIFIEAKSREIYGSNDNDISDAYQSVYKHIHKNLPGFGKVLTSEENNKQSKYKFRYNRKKIVYLDMKQLICHFLAISANYLKPQKGAATPKNKIRFIYLIYNPTKDLKIQQLNDVYNNAINEIKDIDMVELFKVIFNYQKKENKKLKIQYDKSMPKFEFVLADQYTIKEHI